MLGPAAVQSVAAFAGFDFGKLIGDSQAVANSICGNGVALGF